MTKAHDEIKIKNQFRVLAIRPASSVRVYSHTFNFTPTVQIAPSHRFKPHDMGHIKGSLSRKEIYEDLA